LARGRSQLTSGRGSITAQATPCRLSSMAAASPTGPPPAMRTGIRAGGGSGQLSASSASGSIGAGQSTQVTVTLSGLLSIDTTITVNPGGQSVHVLLGASVR
jgi:hypothetical protein